MKKVKSAVWRFFDRVVEDNRCVAVLCKLCENQYKYFGNTTNLRVHLINKHPIQWGLSESGNLDESSFQEASVKPETRSPRKKKYAPRNSDKNSDVLDQNSDSEVDDEATTINMVRQMHGEENSAEEWLEEDPFQITHIETFEPKPKRRKVKYRKIKREIQSPTDLPGFYVAPKPEKVVYEEPHVRKDEYSVFGEYVANKLRKIKLPRTRGNLQQLITTLLWQADYGLYDSAEAVKRVLMVSVTDAEPELVNNATVEFLRTSQPESVNNTTVQFEQEHADTNVDSGEIRVQII